MNAADNKGATYLKTDLNGYVSTQCNKGSQEGVKTDERCYDQVFIAYNKSYVFPADYDPRFPFHPPEDWAFYTLDDEDSAG